jgi:prevent-host-death family protein
MQAIKIGVREAKIQLSKLLEEVKKGREIIITNHDRPVGKIVPVPQESLSLKERIQQLEQQRAIEPKSSKHKKRVPPPLPVPDEMAQKYLKEDRES